MHAPLFPSFARNVIFSWEMNKVSIYPSINLSVYPSIHQTLLSQSRMWSGILFQHKRLRVRLKFFLLNCSNNSINPIKDTVGSMFFSYSTFINVSVSHPSFPVLHHSPDQCPRTQRWEEYLWPIPSTPSSLYTLQLHWYVDIVLTVLTVNRMWRRETLTAVCEDAPFFFF